MESSLHLSLSEHINSEIGLGTITDVRSAAYVSLSCVYRPCTHIFCSNRTWLHNSFLFQRIRQNPKHYAINKDPAETWEEKLDNMVQNSIKELTEQHLVVTSGEAGDGLASTEFGDIMSKVRDFCLILGTLTNKLTSVLHTPSNSEPYMRLIRIVYRPLFV